MKRSWHEDLVGKKRLKLSDELALIYAVEDGDYEYVEVLLLSGMDPNVYDEKGNTPLHYSAANGDYEICALLIKHKGDIFRKNSRAQVPLHLAVVNGNLETVHYLSDMNSNIQEQDVDGITPFHLACLHGRMEIVEYFVMEQFVPPEISYAVKGNHPDIVDFLLARGAKPCVRSLYYSIKNNNGKMFKQLIEFFEEPDKIKYMDMKIPQMIVRYNAWIIKPLYEKKVLSESRISKITDNLDKICIS